MVASPALPRYVDALQALLADERTRREQFYEEMTEEQKIEFVNGKIFTHSPVKARHLDVGGNLYFLPKFHVARRELGWVANEKALVCPTRNDYEPDVVFFGQEKAVSIQPDQMKFPAPDFVAEVLSSSTEHHDRGVKFEDYAAHGVAEDWIIDPVAQKVEQYALPPGGTEYEAVGIWSGQDEVVSVAVPGFRLSAAALFDREANLAALMTLTTQT